MKHFATLLARLGTLAAVLFLLGTLQSCDKSAKGDGDDADSTSAEGDLPESPEDADHKEAVCIWDGIGIWGEYSPKLKDWKAKLAVGEIVEILDQAEVTENGKTVTYIKVKQADTDKQGWVASYYVVPGGKAAAVTSRVDMYSRPALVAKDNQAFEAFDIVAITAEKDDWVRVTGKRREGKWMDKDKWVKNRGLSKEEKDLAVAALVGRALTEKDTKKRLTALKEIVDNPDLAGSVFEAEVRKSIEEIESGDAGDYIQPLDTSGI